MGGFIRFPIRETVVSSFPIDNSSRWIETLTSFDSSSIWTTCGAAWWPFTPVTPFWSIVWANNQIFRFDIIISRLRPEMTIMILSSDCITIIIVGSTENITCYMKVSKSRGQIYMGTFFETCLLNSLNKCRVKLIPFQIPLHKKQLRESPNVSSNILGWNWSIWLSQNCFDNSCLPTG